MKTDCIACTILAACFSFAWAAAQTVPTAPVTVTVNTASHVYAIPIDFSGIGFERGTLNSGNAGASGYMFSPSNAQLVTLFQNLSIKNLRIGGGSVDDEIPVGTGSDGYAGVDALFGFAQAAGTRVIYTFRLLNPSSKPIPALMQDDEAAGQYVWSHYSPLVQSFAIGNEPDFFSYHTVDPLIYQTLPGRANAGTAFPSYLADWQNFAGGISSNAPGASFSGPDSGSYNGLIDYNGIPWTISFANSEAGSGIITDVTQHLYVGGSTGGMTAQQAIDDMLSPGWVNSTELTPEPEGTSTSSTYTPYPWLYANDLAPIADDNLPYRLTESDDFLTGVNGASNAFSSALWTLDYMQWWAQHGAAGVNFHNKQWIFTDTIVPGNLVSGSCNPAPCSNYQIAPKGYGIKAFDLGGHGYVEPVTVSNPQNANVTAYAVGEGQDLYVTVINKTHSSTNDVTDAAITLNPDGFTAASAAWMALSNGNPGNAASTAGTTLGGAAIANSGPWPGDWTPLSPSTGNGVTLTVPSTSAAVIHLRAASNYSGPIQINQDGSVVLFSLDSSGNVWYDAQQSADVPASSPNNWTGWTELSGVTATGGPAVVKNDNATLEVFVPGANGDVWHNWQSTPGGAWNGWVDMGSDSSGITGLRAANNADGSLSVFGVGSNGDIRYSRESAPEVGWSAWSDLTGTQIQPGFAVGQDLDGLLEIFGVDPNGQPWQNAQNASGGWTGWTQMPAGGSGFDASFLPWLATARNLDGRLTVFAADSQSHVLSFTQLTPGGALGQPQNLGFSVTSGFVAGQDKEGRLVLFAGQKSVGQGPLDNNQQEAGTSFIWSIAQLSPGGAWGQWMPIGRMRLASDLAAGNTQDGRIQLFAVAGNGDVWANWQDASYSWNGWADFGDANGAALRFQP